jgi:hypothetical protein
MMHTLRLRGTRRQALQQPAESLLLLHGRLYGLCTAQRTLNIEMVMWPV